MAKDFVPSRRFIPDFSSQHVKVSMTNSTAQAEKNPIDYEVLYECVSDVVCRVKRVFNWSTEQEKCYTHAVHLSYKHSKNIAKNQCFLTCVKNTDFIQV